MKRNELSSHEKTWRILKCTLLCERCQSEKAAYGRIPTIGYSGRGKTVEILKRSVVVRGSRGGGEGWIGGAQVIFRAVKLFCMILWWRIHDILHLSKLLECTIPRVNTNVNHGIWVFITCQCRFTKPSKCIILVEVDSGGCYSHVGVGGIWEFSVPCY